MLFLLWNIILKHKCKRKEKTFSSKHTHTARINFYEKTSTFALWAGNVTMFVCCYSSCSNTRARALARSHMFLLILRFQNVPPPPLFYSTLPFGFIIALPFAIFRGWITYVELTWMGCEVINPVRAVCQGCYSIRLHGSHLGSIICR